MIGKLTEPRYPVPLVGAVCEPAQEQPDGAWFTSWTEIILASRRDAYSETPRGYWPTTGGETFWDVSRGAMGFAASLPGGAAAWKRFQDGIAQMSVDAGRAELER